MNAAMPDPSACGTCRALSAAGRPVEHDECAARAVLLEAPDQPSYEELVDLTEEQRAALPARFHTPWFDADGTPNAWLCRVCWGDGWVTQWPCATAVRHGAEVFTSDAERALTTAAAEVERLRARVAELEAERHSTNEALSDAAEALRANRDRIAELEQLRPARFQDCRVCGAGYEYGSPCSQCEFRKRMAAEARSLPQVDGQPAAPEPATYLLCPVASCEYRAAYDPEHVTPDPEIPASADLAHDEIAEHMVAEHGLSDAEVAAGLSHWRRVVAE